MLMTLKMLPTVTPNLSGPTVSRTRARPTVQTVAALIPWRIRAPMREPMLWPTESKIVLPSNEINPPKKGVCLDDSLSAMMPAGKE